MFRKSKASEISEFFALPLEKNEVAVYYLNVSGIIARTNKLTVMFDPAGMLKSDEITALRTLNLLFFTHNHMDHFKAGATKTIVETTSALVVAEDKVANKLAGKIPAEKLVSAKSGKTYIFGEITVKAIAGIHRGPIILFYVKMGDVTVFHGGDSGYVSLTDYPSDVAIVPVGRLSPTASPEKAYKMVTDVKPQVTVTMHGSDKQKHELESKVTEGMPQTAVLIMKPFTMQKITLHAKA